MDDKDDVHVAVAAGWLSKQSESDFSQAKATQGLHGPNSTIILLSDKIKDFPSDVLAPHGVLSLHAGHLLELLFERDSKRVAETIRKTFDDFKNPPFSAEMRRRSIESQAQFNSPELAAELEVEWSGQCYGQAKSTP